MAIDFLPFTTFHYNYHYEHSYENESTMDDNAMTSLNTINKQKIEPHLYKQKATLTVESVKSEHFSEQ